MWWNFDKYVGVYGITTTVVCTQSQYEEAKVFASSKLPALGSRQSRYSLWDSHEANARRKQTALFGTTVRSSFNSAYPPLRYAIEHFGLICAAGDRRRCPLWVY